MKRISEDRTRLLLLLRLDAQRLFERIKYREVEYMRIFSMKRTREHFKDVFRNRYESCVIAELRECGEEVIVGLDQFYYKVDELRWYLNTTEDMPGTVEDTVSHFIRDLEDRHETLQLYISAELEGGRPEDIDVPEVVTIEAEQDKISFEGESEV
jgi:hypothetical protein